MRSLALATVSLLALSAADSALAAPAVDAAYTKAQKPVYDSQGHCVRTIWHEDADPCAPATPPAPKPVAVAPAPKTVVLPAVSQEQRTIYFEFDKANIDLQAQQKLDQLANIINKSSAITDVSIHGFTDQLGTDSYNEALAHKRAQAVKAYLDSKSRLKATEGDIRGLGKSAPEAQCEAIKKRAEKISCMMKERRVEVEFKAQE